MHGQGRRRGARQVIGWAGLAGVALLAVGCDGAAEVDAGADDAGLPDAGPSCTEAIWDPAGGTLTRWPEPSLLVEDATTETGLRIRFDEADYPMLVGQLRGYRQVFTEDLAELDGFGINAEAFFTFGRAFDVDALPTAEPTAERTAGLGLVIVSPGPPRLHPVLVESTDDGRTLLLAPMSPLPAKAEVAAFVTDRLAPMAGGCLAASPAVRTDLEAPDARARAALDALTSLGVVASTDELVAFVAFPTQSIEEDTIAVAADITARPAPTFVTPPTCAPDGDTMIRCDSSFISQDYRDEDGVFRRAVGQVVEPVTSYEVPVTFWLPVGATAPYPTILFGHGLGGDRNQARRLAQFAAPQGWATVSAPALSHGEHPTHLDPDGATLSVVLEFFAIGDINERALHATRLREHFRQTSWDRLQLTRLLQSAPDVDGDGAPDVDPDALSYLGVSLGGLMGPEVLAATDAYSAGVLVVPGGRVSTIMYASSLFGALVDLLRPRTATAGDVRRFFPILQTVLDAGDPASYGAHGLQDRFASAPRVPSVLLGVVLDDEVVPNVANYALGRAYGVPIVAPLLREEPGFEVVTGPLTGNFDEGRATGGLLQFDYVRDGEMVVRATHDNVGDSDVGADAWFDFLRSHLDDGLARVRDPYAATSFPRP
ncbi:MAG: hypothetical protein H6719_32560 [Sandaracinaceae bacterium]|nr:hypothetical protein [Sandaracinaceae bacterium]